MSKRKIYALLMALVFAGACTDRSFEDINTNINEVTNPNPVYLINGTIGALFNNNSQWHRIAELSHQLACTGNPSGNYHRFSTGVWGTYSANINLKDAIRRTKGKEDEPSRMAYALAKIFRVYAFHKLTDCYGDIPFSEAGNIKAGVRNVTPKYDDQKSIYYALFEDLEEAISIIGDTNAELAMGSADRVYAGNMKLWGKFANSLRLRMAMRIRFVDQAKSAEVLEKVWQGPLIDSMEESAAFKNFDEPGYYFYGYGALRAETRTNTSKKMVNFLKENNDPRLASYALPVLKGDNAGGYAGLPNGYEDDKNRDNFSYVGRVTYQKDLPTVNIMYSEVCFLKAEAYLFGLGVAQSDAQAQAWYVKGIEASMKFWRRKDTFIRDGKEATEYLYTEKDIADFMKSTQAILSGTQEERFEQICMQKWTALMNNWIEAYSDMRRTGYPKVAQRKASDVPSVSLGDTNGEWPRRAPYPNSEALYNRANYDKASAATNGNSMTNRVWWDVR